MGRHEDPGTRTFWETVHTERRMKDLVRISRSPGSGVRERTTREGERVSFPIQVQE